MTFTTSLKTRISSLSMPMQTMKDQMKHKLTAKKFGTLNIGVPEVPEKGQRLIVTGQSLGRKLLYPFSMG